MAKDLGKSAFGCRVVSPERHGYISDSKAWKGYKVQRRELNAGIKRNACVVFVTTSSAGGTFLKFLLFPQASSSSTSVGVRSRRIPLYL